MAFEMSARFRLPLHGFAVVRTGATSSVTANHELRPLCEKTHRPASEAIALDVRGCRILGTRAERLHTSLIPRP